jgi:hypothetical protein
MSMPWTRGEHLVMKPDLWPIRFVEKRPGRENGEQEQRRLRVKATREGALAWHPWHASAVVV